MALTPHATIVLRPTLAFIKWAKSTTTDSEFAEDLNAIIREKAKQDGHTYLIPVCDGDDELAQFIKGKSTDLLSNELSEWQIDPEVWPAELSEGLFRQWFTITFSEMVFDASVV